MKEFFHAGGDGLPLVVYFQIESDMSIGGRYSWCWRESALTMFAVTATDDRFNVAVLHPMRSSGLCRIFLHHRFVIGPVADVHLGDGVAFVDDEVGADAVEEPAVVADDEGDACEFGEGFFEGAQGVDVEVVGGFIEQQDVGAFGEGLGEMDAVAFTA
jgi:hypothetical protein